MKHFSVKVYFIISSHVASQLLRAEEVDSKMHYFTQYGDHPVYYGEDYLPDFVSSCVCKLCIMAYGYIFNKYTHLNPRPSKFYFYSLCFKVCLLTDIWLKHI